MTIIVIKVCYKSVLIEGSLIITNMHIIVLGAAVLFSQQFRQLPTKKF